MSKKIIINNCGECPYLSMDSGTTGLHNLCMIRHLKDNVVFFIENINEIAEHCPLEDDKKAKELIK